MSKKITFLSVLMVILGEGLIVAIFLRFLKPNLPENVMWLDLIVTSIVYLLILGIYQFPWINLKDKSQSDVGSLGIKWVTAHIYPVGAVAVMLLGYFLQWSFDLQLILQGVMVLILGFMLITSMHASDKVAEIHNVETALRYDVESMRRVMKQLCNAANKSDNLPAESRKAVESILEDLRYASPVNTRDGANISADFCELAETATSKVELGAENIQSEIAALRSLLNDYRSSYSN